MSWATQTMRTMIIRPKRVAVNEPLLLPVYPSLVGSVLMDGAVDHFFTSSEMLWQQLNMHF